MISCCECVGVGMSLRGREVATTDGMCIPHEGCLIYLWLKDHYGWNIVYTNMGHAWELQTVTFFSLLYVHDGWVQITVQKPVKDGQEEVIDLELEQTSCEVCGGSDREDRLLLCDGCDAGWDK